MKLTRRKTSLSGVLCMVLIAAMALTATGCSTTKSESPSVQSETSNVFYQETGTIHQLGEGQTTFPFTVVDLEGGEVAFEISTDAETVGDALQEVSLIAGEEGPFGLMVAEVNGQRHVYEEGSYWAFYVDGAYAMTGVDETPIEAGKDYSFQATKA